MACKVFGRTKASQSGSFSRIANRKAVGRRCSLQWGGDEYKQHVCSASQRAHLKIQMKPVLYEVHSRAAVRNPSTWNLRTLDRTVCLLPYLLQCKEPSTS